MVCEVKENAIKTLMKTKSVDDSRKIINEPLFEKVNRALTDIAIERYGLKTNGQLLENLSRWDFDECTKPESCTFFHRFSSSIY